MSKSKTAQEKEYMDRVQRLGCIVCVREGLGQTPASIHHLRDGMGMSQRNSNFDIIGLCPTHHQYSAAGHIAFHAAPKQFRERYGTERELEEAMHDLYRAEYGEEPPTQG